jgi:hypothetical protein
VFDAPWRRIPVIPIHHRALRQSMIAFRPHITRAGNNEEAEELAWHASQSSTAPT